MGNFSHFLLNGKIYRPEILQVYFDTYEAYFPYFKVTDCLSLLPWKQFSKVSLHFKKQHFSSKCLVNSQTVSD